MGTKSKIIIGVLVAIFMSALIYQISTKEKTINNNKELVLTSNINKITQNDKQVNPPMPQKVPSFITRGEGVGWSEDKLLSNTSDIYKAQYPAITTYGNFVHIAYEHFWGSGFDTYSKILYIRSDDNGHTWNHPINVSTNPKYSSLPDITAYNEHVYIVWQDVVSNKKEVYINISHDYGNTWTGEFNISKIDGYESGWPSIATDGNKVVVVWADNRVTNNGHDLYIRISTDNGTTWGHEIRITNMTDIDPFYDDMNPDVVLKNNTIYLAFDRAFPSTGYYETMFMRSDDLGQTWTDPVRLSCLDAYNCYVGGIAVDNNGHVYVVWENSTPEDEIYLRRSDDNGTTWYEEQRLTWDDNRSVSPSICVGENGEGEKWPFRAVGCHPPPHQRVQLRHPLHRRPAPESPSTGG